MLITSERLIIWEKVNDHPLYWVGVGLFLPANAKIQIMHVVRKIFRRKVCVFERKNDLRHEVQETVQALLNKRNRLNN